MYVHNITEEPILPENPISQCQSSFSFPIDVVPFIIIALILIYLFVYFILKMIEKICKCLYSLGIDYPFGKKAAKKMEERAQEERIYNTTDL